jgi:RND family efflux transporter MFP subunit
MKKYISSLLTAGIAVLLASCSGGDKDGNKTEEEDLPPVKLETVTSRIVDQIGTYTATVEPELINNITTSTPNRIKQILVDEGMQVKAGQTLVILDDVNSYTYETQVANAKANLKNVEDNYNRAVELYKIGGGTKQSVDQMELQLINAKNTLAQTERALRNCRENTVLTSPISGVVTARNYDPGDMTGSLPILTVARTQPLKIVINVSEGDLPKVHKGMPAEVTFDTYGDEKFQGTVSVVMPTVDTASRTFGVEVALSNPNGRILPGMFGRVKLNLGQANRVVVPDKAVMKQVGSGRHYVYVYNADNTVTYSEVELGQRLGNEYELISGVDDGAQLVVSGQSKLANGKKVKVTK